MARRGVCFLRRTALPLTLRSAFGTSHSLTTTRTNAAVRVAVTVGDLTVVGAGEVGLPPRKPGVYDATYDDCAVFVGEVWDAFQADVGNHTRLASKWGGASASGLLVGDLLQPAAASLSAAPGSPPHVACCLLATLLRCSDTCPPAARGEAWVPAASSGVESAVMDAWGQAVGVPVFQLLGLELPARPAPTWASFYTAALAPDVADIVTSAQFGSGYTPHLKVKVNGSFEDSVAVLEGVLAAFKDRYDDLYKARPVLWSVDANAAWTPAVAMRFLGYFQTFGAAAPPGFQLYMVEQPFPHDLVRRPAGVESGGDATLYSVAAWREVADAYRAADFWIYADESVCNAADVEALAAAGVCHGCNVKLEKAGGLRGGIKALLAAKGHGLGCWLGCMVGSARNSLATAHLLPLANHCDLDGALLVVGEGVVDTGYEFLKDDGVPTGDVGLPTAPGLGMPLP